MHTRTAMMPHPATMPRTKSLGEKELGIDECCSVDERIGDGSRPCGFVAVVAEQLKGQKVPCSSGGVLKYLPRTCGCLSHGQNCHRPGKSNVLRRIQVILMA
jgi:hypothetical protein